MNIKINILEVASELAHKEVEKAFNFNPQMIFDWVSDEESRYTNDAQEIFNQYYDEYYDFLLKLKE